MIEFVGACFDAYKIIYTYTYIYIYILKEEILRISCTWISWICYSQRLLIFH